MTQEEKKQALWKLVDERRGELLQICSDLIRIPSVDAAGIEEILQYTCAFLDKLNISYEVLRPDGDVPCIAAELGTDTGKIGILNGHNDVVGPGDQSRWSYDPFCGTVTDTQVLGRGASDMKCGTGVLLFMLKLIVEENLRPRGKVKLHLVHDEERGGEQGSKWLTEHGYADGADFCIVTEPTSYDYIEVGQKSRARLRRPAKWGKRERMTGTLINAAAVAAGGSVGLLLKKSVARLDSDSINKAMGIAVIVLGLNGVISSMFTIGADGGLSSSGELLLIVSLVLGVIAGEALRIDDRLNGLSGLVEEKLHLTGFAQSFVNGTLIYCVGAMAIIGALNDGLRGDASVLYVKSLLDGISSVVLAATMGPGVIFAAVPVLLYQGAITLLAGAVEPLLAGALLDQICAVGYCLVLCIGVNFLGAAKIKTANLLPELLVPVMGHFIAPLFAGIL